MARRSDTASAKDRDTWATFRPPLKATLVAGFTAEAAAEGYDLAWSSTLAGMGLRHYLDGATTSGEEQSYPD